eukprot:5060666-Alexandrium_andersonii.AAC.1
MCCSTRYVNASKVEAGAWLEGCEQSFGRRYVHPASRAAVEVFWAARPHTAEATEGLGLNVSAAQAGFPPRAGLLAEKTDVAACNLLDVF